MKTELNSNAVLKYLRELSENLTADSRTKTINEIYDLGYENGQMDMIMELGPDEICVGNKVCETLAETMKSAYLAEIFDKFSEQDFRNMSKNYVDFLRNRKLETA
jgi:hypothetical protein